MTVHPTIITILAAYGLVNIVVMIGAIVFILTMPDEGEIEL